MTVNSKWIGYAAGLFDGEGTVGAYPNGYRNNGIKYIAPTPVYRLRIAMTDEDALDSFHWAVGMGKIYGPWRNGKSPIPIFSLDILGFEKVQAVCAMLWPYLSQRRKDQIKKALTTKGFKSDS